jgi:CDP-glycerol glycerophosphotransferase (TagB/SpsB family)
MRGIDMNINIIVIIVLFSFLHSLFSRLRETCIFETWTSAWLVFWKIDENSAAGRWWASRDEYELKGWYNYLWRDGYHTFKLVLELLMFGILIFYNRYWIYGLVIWIVIQYLYDLFIDLLISKTQD